MSTQLHTTSLSGFSLRKADSSCGVQTVRSAATVPFPFKALHVLQSSPSFLAQADTIRKEKKLTTAITLKLTFIK